MMWKESYELGNELIDAQHKELFDKTEKLLRIVDGKDFLAKKQECIDAILFLKDYAIKHFAAEEEFQASVRYVGIDVHKLIHSEFIHSVLAAEQNLIDTDFSLPSIKEFCGFLTAWLIYHVAGADRKIVKQEGLSYDELAIILSPKECFMRGIEDVFATMFNEPAGIAKSSLVMESNDIICIKIAHTGDWKRDVVFTFSKETALDLVNSLTDLGLTEIDELADSALREIATLILDKTVSLIKGIKKADEAEAPEESDFAFNTKHGVIAISVSPA